MAVQVSVIGSGTEHEKAAEEVGRLLAERGCVVVTGGLGEVMAAAHRGAKAAGGTTIAIVPGESRGDANPWADHVVVTGIGHARNLAVAASGTPSSRLAEAGGPWPRSGSRCGSGGRSSCSTAPRSTACPVRAAPRRRSTPSSPR